MATVIVPTPAFAKIGLTAVRAGDWISDDAIRWHLVRERRTASLLLGDTDQDATEVAADFAGTILRLHPAAVPRTGWSRAR